MNLNNLAAKVASLTNREIDGDMLLKIEQYLPVALEAACKFIAATKPLGHEKIIKVETVTEEDFIDFLGYDAISIPDSIPNTIITNPLHLVHIQDSEEGDIKMENCNSLDALSLSVVHDAPYYYIKEPYILFFIPAKFTGVTALVISSHSYISITNFPDYLEEYLIAELLKFVQPNIAPTNE